MALPDLTELEEAATVRNTGGQRCRTCEWLDSLPDDYRDLFNRLLADPEVQSPRIYEQAKRCGYEWSNGAWDNHRRNHVPS